MHKKEFDKLIKKIEKCDLSVNDKSKLVEIVNSKTLSNIEKLANLGKVFKFSLEILEKISRFLE